MLGYNPHKYLNLLVQKTHMVNFQERVLQYPQYCRQFSCSESMITIFSCPPEARLMKNK